MPTIQCVCGTRFSVDRAAPDGTVYCPSCGQALAPLHNAGKSVPFAGEPPPGGQQTSHGQYVGGAHAAALPPVDSNPSAIAGFVLSMLSLFGCLVLAPISVFVSCRGLKKDANRGLAIAGVVVGSIQSVALLILVAYFIVVAVMVGGFAAATASFMGKTRKEMEKSLATDAALENAVQSVFEFHEAEGRWPNGKEGAEVIEGTTDGWGNELVYDATDDESWRVVSLGPDGEFETFDDIERVQENFLAVRDGAIPLDNDFQRPLLNGRSEVVPTVTSVEQALDVIGSNQLREQEDALEWLATAPVRDDLREEVVQTLLELLDERRLQQASLAALRQWVGEGEQDQVVAFLQGLPEHGVDSSLLVLLDLLESPGSGARMISLVNHPSRMIRDKSRGWARNQGSLETTVVEQCIEDLSIKERKEFAAEWLKVLAVQDELRLAVSEALDKALEDRDYSVRRESLEALKHWGPTEKNIQTLADLGELELLLQIHHPDVLKELGKMLENWPIEFRKAANQLRKVGPAGERYVWPVLENRSHVVVREALQLLGEIGTAESLPKIEPLLEHTLLKGEAAKAIQQIKLARRSPAEWTVN